MGPKLSHLETVEDRDFGYADAVRALTRLDVAVVVGILQDKGAEMTDDGITLAGYAAANEFGTDTIPERSFMRSTVAENERRYVDELVEAARSVVVDRVDIEVAFGLVGSGAAADVQDKIRDLRDPPNAPMTLARKYPGDNPLIDTGRMRQAISFGVIAAAASEGVDFR